MFDSSNNHHHKTLSRDLSTHCRAAVRVIRVNKLSASSTSS